MDFVYLELIRKLIKNNNKLVKLTEKNNFYKNNSDSWKILKKIKKNQKILDLYKQFLFFVETNKKNEKNKLIEKDPEIIELINAEINLNLKKISDISENIKIAFMPEDKNNICNSIIEIKGTSGGQEGNIFAGDIFNMYLRYAEKMQWKIEILNLTESLSGGFSIIDFIVIGKNSFSKLKYESGIHRVQRVPKTGAKDKMHTSAASVYVFPEIKKANFQLKKEDLKIDTYRASGAGGQHVNTTDSAIRITHIPTGIFSCCQSGRSQHDNKDKALKLLYSKIYNFREKERIKNESMKRGVIVGTGDRSEKIRTYNFPRNQVIEHRIDKKNNALFSLQKILNGDMEKMINMIILYEKRKKLLKNL